MFQAVVVSVLRFGCTKTNFTLGAKAKWEQHKNAMCCFKQIQEEAPTKNKLYDHLPLI